MAAYVDELQYHDKTPIKGRHLWCHLTADSDEELHAMALAIGMKREWFQPHPKGNHYDLVPARRLQAIALGAIEEHSRARVRRLRQTTTIKSQEDAG